MKALRAKIRIDPQANTEVEEQNGTQRVNDPVFTSTFSPQDLLSFQRVTSNVPIASFDLPEDYGIRDPIDAERGFPYFLGSGASCTVLQHETRDDTVTVIAPGSVVALKRYNVDEKMIWERKGPWEATLQAIWYDMRIYCHPNLRDHENIAKLLYFGWEYGSLVPILSLEFAAYGSLKHILHERQDLSEKQKCNISLDIVSGLYALHCNDFAHGDLKPGNVIIQHSPHRQLVAKLIDFCGVIELRNLRSSLLPSYVTPIWLAPEVLTLVDEVDWQKSDIYSFGLLFSQLWSREDKEGHECFLESTISHSCSSTEKQEFLLYFKICPESDRSSVINQAFRTFEHGDTVNNSSLYSSVKKIMMASLASDPKLRCSSEELLPICGHFAESCSRSWSNVAKPFCKPNEDDASILDLTWFESGYISLSETFRAHTRDPPEHYNLTLEYLLKLGREPVLDASPLLAFTDTQTLDTEAAVAKILLSARKVIRKVPEREKYWRKLHFDIAMCYFQGYGTTIDENKGIRYLASAALGGIRNATSRFCNFETSCSQPIEGQFPRRLFLVLSYFDNCSEAGDLLRELHPKTFEAAMRLHLGCWFTAPGIVVHIDDDKEAYDAQVQPEISFKTQKWTDSWNKAIEQRLTRYCEGDGDEIDWHTLYQIAPLPQLSHEDELLLMSIEAEDVEQLRILLEDGGNANATNSTTHLTALHLTSYADDAVAVEMATILVKHGARLDAHSMETMNSNNRVCLGRSYPILWAIVKDRPKLFKTLANFHASTKIDSVDGIPLFTKLLPPVLIRYRRFYMLRTLLQLGLCSPEMLREPECLFWVLDHEFYNDFLGFRWGLGTGFHSFQRETVHLLLSHGADPLSIHTTERYPGGVTPFEYCIANGEGNVLDLYLENLSQRGVALPQFLSNKGGWSHSGVGRGRSALNASLNAHDGSAFLLLLEKYPALVNQPSPVGKTPLHRASGDRSLLWAAVALLDHGAELYCYDANGSTPLITSLIWKSYKIAEMFANRARAHGLLDQAVGKNPVTGCTAFGQLLGFYIAGHRKSITAESFELIRQLGGADFVIGDEGGVPRTVWREFFRRGRSVNPDHRIADLRLLRYFLRKDLFLDRIDEVDWTGRAPLHYTVTEGNVDATMVLLEYEAFPNVCSVECVRAGEVLQHGGLSPLDLAIRHFKQGVPERLAAGGELEKSAWREGVRCVIKALVAKGGECNSASEVDQVMIAKIVDPNTFSHVKILNPSQFWKSLKEERAPTWPKPIPHDPLSPTPKNSRIVSLLAEWFNPESGLSAETYESVFMFRTKIRYRANHHDDLDDPANEYKGEELRQKVREIRAHNASYRRRNEAAGEKMKMAIRQRTLD